MKRCDGSLGFRGALLLASALALSCSGDEDAEAPPENTEGAAGATEASEPPEVTEPQASGPLQAHAATLEATRDQLLSLARSGAFPASTATPLPTLLSGAPAPTRVLLSLQFKSDPGVESVPVAVSIALLPDGAVRIWDLATYSSRDGAPALELPASLAAAAQAVRLLIMDGGCEGLPVTTVADANAALGEIDDYTRTAVEQAPVNCPAANAAFDAATLHVATANLYVDWARPIGGPAPPVRSVSAQIDSAPQLSFSDLAYQAR